MVSKIETEEINFEGGLIKNLPTIEQGRNFPGSLLTAVNYEPGLKGGYRRLSGYAKYDTAAVTGTGEVLGVFSFSPGVIAMRGTGVYSSSGTGWTAINGADTRTGAQKYQGDIYNWAGDTLVFVDGVNKPVKWDGTTYTVLSNAPTGAFAVKQHKDHLFFADGANLVFSVPNDDINYNVIDGGGTYPVGFTITALGVWRDQLYIFGDTNIKRLIGDNSSNFKLEPVSENLGCVARDTLADVGGDLVFLSADGIRTIAGTARISDVELGALSDPIKVDVSSFEIQYLGGSVSAIPIRVKSQYRLFGSQSTDNPDTAFGVLGGIRQVEQGLTWEWFHTKGIWVSCAHSRYAGTTEVVLHGDWDGYVYQQELGNTFDGSSIDSNMETAWDPYDDSALRKTLHNIILYIDQEGIAEIVLQIKFDFGDPNILVPSQIIIGSVGAGGLAVYDQAGVTYDSATIKYDAGAFGKFDENLLGSGFLIALALSSNSVVDATELAAYTVKSAVIEYSLGGRQ